MKSVLIISAKSPYWSSNLGKDYVDGFKMAGCDVQYVGVPDYIITDNQTFYTIGKTLSDRKEPLWLKCVHWFTSIIIVRKLLDWYRYNLKGINIGEHIHFLHFDDLNPTTTWEEWLKAVPNKSYDLIIATHLGGDITSVIIEKFIEYFNAPLLIMAVDMQPMTGGCFYFNDCRGFLNQCKDCKAASLSNIDPVIPHKNFLLKKSIFRKLPVYVGVNSYMKNFFERTGLWQDGHYIKMGCVINEDLFVPMDKKECRKYLNLPESYFIIFSGSRYLFEERKGLSKLISAVERFVEDTNNAHVVVVLAGSSYGKKIRIKGAEVRKVGLLGLDKMIKMYSAVDLYACPSVDDAGPSMVNQAIMCGTPVVAFNTGVAQDIVINDVTGYKYDVGDIIGFSQGIYSVYKRIHDSKPFTSDCRAFAIARYSRKVVANSILNQIPTE